MRIRLPAALSVFLLAAGFPSLEAEERPSEWFVRAWQTEDGLPDNTVTGVVQGPDGYLWIGTNGGLMRFNGTSYTPLPLHQIPDLKSQQVRAMFLDRLGRLWLGMERGPVIRIGEDSFHTFPREETVRDNVVRSMTDDPQGRLWIAYSKGVCRIDDNEVIRFERGEGIPVGSASKVICDTDGQVWLTVGGELGRLSDEGYTPVHDFGNTALSITASKDSGLWLTVDSKLKRMEPGGQLREVAKLPDDVEASVIYEDRDRSVWICTLDSGLLHFKDDSFVRVVTSHPSVDCITEDRDGNIWVGTTGGGLNLVKPRIVKLLDHSAGLPFTSIRSLTCDNSGNLWAVSQSGRLAQQRPDGWTFFNQPDESERINCVAADAGDLIWIGTRYRGLIRLDGDAATTFGKQDGLASDRVRSLLTARDGDVWIATEKPDQLHRFHDGEITRIDYPGSFEAIRALTEDADGTVWVGSSDGLLLRVEGDRLVEEKAVEDIPSIRTLHATPDGSLWIGYAGEGLGHLKDGRYRRITTDEGLFDNYISQIQDDQEGSLWIAANRGLFQVGLGDLLADRASTPGRLRCRVFGRNDGVPSFQPSRNYHPDSCRSPDHQLYFSTSNGIAEARPDMLLKPPLPPPVVLEKVSVDGRTEALYRARSMTTPDDRTAQADLSKPDPRIVLPPGPDRVVVSFAALSLDSPENLGFRYRMRPLVRDWEEPDNRRSATFTRLPAGNYEFQVIACNSAGVWNEVGATLEIVVQPFFWETWWFRIGGGIATALTAGGLVFLALRRKHQRQLRRIAANRALEQERSRIARDIHDDLGANLTRISLLSQRSPADGDAPENPTLDQIQKTARHLMRSMDEVIWAINPEHDTFDDLANYLSSYAQEFLSVADIRCRLEMPIAVLDRSLSAQLRHNLFLAFKESLNNIVKYSGASEVRISLHPADHGFTLKVEDNGRGIDPNASSDSSRPNSGSGLANMVSRMDEIGASCIVKSTLGQGTCVEFRVPFNASF